MKAGFAIALMALAIVCFTAEAQEKYYRLLDRQSG